jgi:hypothetical protein
MNPRGTAHAGERPIEPRVSFKPVHGVAIPPGAYGPRSVEAHVSSGYEEFRELLSLMQVCKAMSETRLPRVTQGQCGHANGSLLTLGRFERRLGLAVAAVPTRRFAAERDGVYDGQIGRRPAE